ncbi:MAG: shikimate kinase [Oscillospiraceae bacterium]|nr:shikimate kinase [Oscillospiraceae bacterium]
MNITLIGMPGSGKSTVGKLLAKRLGYTFLDVDPLIVAAYNAPNLQKVLDDLGPEAFLDAEAHVISAIDCDNTVLAPGGSAVLREVGALHLKALGPVVYLKPSVKALTQRLGNLATRGVTLKPGQTLQDLCDYRAPFYEKYADITIAGNQDRVEETVELVLGALESCNFWK